MKKILVSAVALALGVSSLTSFAKDGTVNFTGKIVESGCEVTNANNGIINVEMGTYSSSSLATTGQTAGPKPFEIDLAKCATGSVKIRFDGTPVSGHTDLLQLTSDAAAGASDPSQTVGIQITDLASSAIYTIGDTSAAVPFQAVDADGALNIKLAARYAAFADGKPAGDANSTTDFSIEYQ